MLYTTQELCSRSSSKASYFPRFLQIAGHFRSSSGHFSSFSTWDDVLNREPNETGSKMLLKPFILRMPAFGQVQPRFNKALGVSSDSHSTAWPYHSLASIAQMLSRIAGLQGKTDLHLLRRGNAYVLLQPCKDRQEAERCMGQVEKSSSFRRYLSEISTTDLLAISRDMQSRDAGFFSGMLLGSVEDAPITLPDSELESIQQETS